MTRIVWVMLFTFAGMSTHAATLTGRVTGPGGSPVGGARVFVEQDLGGAVRETRADGQGAFRFDDVSAGSIGVFAIADGYAFGGLSIVVGASDAASDLTIGLRPPDSVSGRIVDMGGDPLAGAQIVRVALLDEPRPANPHATAKVGIPLTKLAPMGFAVPVSDAKGEFRAPLLPRGTRVALKIAHPGQAQEGVDDVAVGSGDVRVTMQPGVIVRGNVVSRRHRAPVANADIVFRNAQPPRETTVSKTDGQGEFALRLKPGIYVYQASSAELRSPGWQELLVTGAQSVQQVQLYVSGTAVVRGKVCDAVTGNPIAGARLVLEAFGNPAAGARTNAAGEYTLPALEGENTVTLESAAGYLPPTRPARSVALEEGETFQMPTFWLAPIPSYDVVVVDAEMRPVSGVVVSLLRPAQFGWRVTDAEGRVSLSFGALPPDGAVVGLAEHPTRDETAVFAIKASEDDAPAMVQLLPAGRVTGRVAGTDAKGIAGAMVGAVFAHDAHDSPLMLWRAVADREGRFALAGVTPGVMLRCAAHTEEGPPGASAPFHLANGETKDIGDLVVSGGGARRGSMRGAPLPWGDWRAAGGGPAREPAKGRRTVALFCRADEAAMVVEGLTHAQRVVGESGPRFVAVAEGAAPPGADIPVFEGKAPGLATTYVLDEEGRVVYETFGLPPLCVLREAR